MRAAVAAVILLATGRGDVHAEVSTVLSDASIKTMTGCWKVDGQHETWTFKANDAHGLDVVRELPKDAREAARARIPSPVLVSTKDGDFAFSAAGRIHGLMIIFRIDHEVLRASIFTSHDGRSFVFTGNNVVAEHCAR